MTKMSSSDWAKATAGDEVSTPCRILQGLSIDTEFLRALEAPSFGGRVHSVFKRVVNIECTAGKLFTLAGSGLDNAPNTAVVDVTSFEASGIAVNDLVTVAEGKLRVGDGVVMQWTTAVTWQASLSRFAEADGNLQARLDWTWSYLGRNGVQGGIVGQDLSDNSFARMMSVTLQERSGSLLEALEQMRMTSACQHAKSIIGLGPGLTPAGDDFLVGLFAVLNLPGSPCCGWLGGGKDVLSHAEQSTNAISLAALTPAAYGHVRESISRLIETLICGTPATLTEALDRVLAIGSTSGSDLVAGILAGLNLNLRVEAIRSGNLPPQEPASAYNQRNLRGAYHDAIKSTGVY
jgi:hypothetical protein